MAEIIVLIAQAVNYFASFIYLLIFVRCILSWIPGLYNNPIAQFVYRLTEPILGPIRRMLDRSPIGGGMGLDFSPIIAYFVIMIIQKIIYSVLIFILQML